MRREVRLPFGLPSRNRKYITVFDIGRTLEETAALFDGEDKQKDVAQAGGEAATMIRSQGTAPIELEDGYAFEPSYEPSTREPKEKSHSPTTDTFELRRTGSSGEMNRWDREMSIVHAF